MHTFGDSGSDRRFHVDSVVVQEADRLSTLVEDLPAAALVPLLEGVRKHRRSGCDVRSGVPGFLVTSRPSTRDLCCVSCDAPGMTTRWRFCLGPSPATTRQRRGADGELAVFDLSVVVRGQSGDTFRTFTVGESATDAQFEAHGFVARALNHVLATVKPGRSCKALFEAGPELHAGIRIEDNYLLTADGVEQLCRFPIDL